MNLPAHDHRSRRYCYHPEVLAELSEHGVRPTAETAPSLVRAYLNDLYRWELRQLRNQVAERTLPKSALAARVVALRKRYVLLSVPVEAWTSG